jgi:hypothetical protein
VRVQADRDNLLSSRGPRGRRSWRRPGLPWRPQSRPGSQVHWPELCHSRGPSHGADSLLPSVQAQGPESPRGQPEWGVQHRRPGRHRVQVGPRRVGRHGQSRLAVRHVAEQHPASHYGLHHHHQQPVLHQPRRGHFAVDGRQNKVLDY